MSGSTRKIALQLRKIRQRFSGAQVSVAIVLATLCTAVGPSRAGDIRVGVRLSDDIYLAPIYAAEKLRLFAVAGITVQRVPMRGIDVSVEALKAGHVDLIDAPGPAAALENDGGLPGKIVTTNASGFYGWTVIVNSQSGYQSIGELQGKVLGITTARSLASMAATLAKTRSDISFDVQAVGAGALIPMLRQNKLQAVISSATLGLREVSVGRARIVFDLSLGAETFAVSTLIASNSMMNKRNSDLRAFLAARAEALRHMQANRAWSIDVIKEYANLADTALVERLYDNIIRRMRPDGKTHREAIKAALDLAAKAWNTPGIGKIDPDALFTNDFALIQKQ